MRSNAIYRPKLVLYAETATSIGVHWRETLAQSEAYRHFSPRKRKDNRLVDNDLSEN